MVGRNHGHTSAGECGPMCADGGGFIIWHTRIVRHQCGHSFGRNSCCFGFRFPSPLEGVLRISSPVQGEVQTIQYSCLFQWRECQGVSSGLGIGEDSNKIFQNNILGGIPTQIVASSNHSVAFILRGTTCRAICLLVTFTLTQNVLACLGFLLGGSEFLDIKGHLLLTLLHLKLNKSSSSLTTLTSSTLTTLTSSALPFLNRPI